MPPDGSLDVPVNIELEAVPRASLGFASPTIAVSLRLADTGEEVPLIAAPTPGRFRPEVPLLPDTRYELLAPREVPLRPSSPPCTALQVVVASFTTGGALDTLPPTALTASDGECRAVSCADSGCCGPFVATISTARWSAVDEGALPVAYAFGSPEGPRTFATQGSATSWSGIGGGPLAGHARIPGPSPVFAIDAAGNVSPESASFALDLSCASPPADPEPLGCDGGDCPPESGGCSATRGASSGALVGAALLAIAALARRRRRGAVDELAARRRR